MKKALMTLVMVMALVLCFAVVSFAATTESNAYADTFDTVDGIPAPTVLDADARTVIVVNGTYYTIPTYYLIKDQAYFEWAPNALAVEAFGIPSNSNVRANIVRIEIPEGIETSYENGSGGTKLEDAKALIEASFPSTMRIIGSHFFNRCSALEVVHGFENTKITRIYENTFNGTLISEITIPNTVTRIDGYAFGSTKLTSVVVPSGVTIIGDYAFAIKTLTDFSFANNESSLVSMGKYVFEDAQITSFKFASTITSLGMGVFNRCSKLVNIEGFENTGITSIPTNLFNGAGITSLTLPKNITSIGDSAFRGIKLNQDELRIPNGVTTIGDHAFAACGSVKTLVLPASLTTLTGEYTFENFKPTTVYIPDTLATIAKKGTFNGHSSSGVVFYFTGTETHANTLKSTAETATANDAFKNATVISLDGYNALTASEKSKANYIVYGYNACDAFYFGIHEEKLNEGETDANLCVLTLCANCGISNVYVGDETTHTFAYTYAYANGYNNKGTTTCACTNAGCKKSAENGPEVTTNLAPIFTFLGYSTNDVNTEFAIGFSVDKTALAYFEENANVTLEYGVIAAAGNNDPMNAVDIPTIKANVPETVSSFNLRIRGFNTDEDKATSISMGMFVKTTDEGANTTSAYIQEEQGATLTAYTLAQYIVDNTTVA